MKKQAALALPVGLDVLVFKDDGNWDKYRSWFMRSTDQLEDLFVARITLGHYEGSDEPDYDHNSWCRKSEQLVKRYPGCIFVYGV